MAKLLSKAEWLELTKLPRVSRSSALEKVDIAIADYGNTPGSLAFLQEVERRLQAWLKKKGKKKNGKWDTERDHRGAVTLLIKQIADLNTEAIGQTNSFKGNTKQFLKGTILDCFGALEKSLSLSSPPPTLYNEKRDYECAIMPIDETRGALNVLSPQLPMPGGGSPIPARILAFQLVHVGGQQGVDQMGYVDVAEGGGDAYVVTGGLTGCTIVAVRVNGNLRFYHEPTKKSLVESWKQAYPGTALLRAGSREGMDVANTAIMYRTGGQWHIIIQSFECNLMQRPWVFGKLLETVVHAVPK